MNANTSTPLNVRVAAGGVAVDANNATILSDAKTIPFNGAINSVFVFDTAGYQSLLSMDCLVFDGLE